MITSRPHQRPRGRCWRREPPQVGICSLGAPAAKDCPCHAGLCGREWERPRVTETSRWVFQVGAGLGAVLGQRGLGSPRGDPGVPVPRGEHLLVPALPRSQEDSACVHRDLSLPFAGILPAEGLAAALLGPGPPRLQSLRLDADRSSGRASPHHTEEGGFQRQTQTLRKKSP